LKHRRKKHPFREEALAFISDQRHGLMAHFNSAIHDMKTDTSSRNCYESLHDKPSDYSDLFSIRSEYQLSLLSVIGLK